jgi:hypothetical protein
MTPPSPHPDSQRSSDPVTDVPVRANTHPSIHNDPAELTIPSLHIDAAIIAVGVDESGQMQVPQLVSQIGWYKYGPARPGRRAARSSSPVTSIQPPKAEAHSSTYGTSPRTPVSQ